jgi:DNA polymerase-3 subunit alpha
MRHSNFVHLHLHTFYSLLDSSIRPEALFKKAEQYKMPAIAMTDHGNMFGAVEFYNGARSHGLKPIIGCEVYVAPESRFEKTDKQGLRDASYHLILLAKSETGYKNLVRLITAGYLEGFYYKPRIDKELLARHAEGLIALSSCARGEVAHNINRENLPRAAKVAAQYKDIMGAGNFFLELQYHNQDWQEKINRETIDLGQKLDLPVVATNNCHYLEKEDARAHEILLCLQTGKTISDQYRMQYPGDEYYFKSPEEMTKIFGHVSGAIENTIKIAEHCNFEMQFGQYHLPDYPVPESYTLASYLEEQAKAGLKERLAVLDTRGEKPDIALYQARLESELATINRMRFPGYFLVVWDFIRYAKENGIPVGPGRGSAAGSLTAYSLKITDLDPIKYDLLFERFLNPERISLPDIDIDFCMDRRDEVIRYVTQKYGGNENVSQIITFGSMNAKGVIRDVGRVLDLAYGEVDKIAKLIPTRLNITLKEAFKEESKFGEIRKENPKYAELLDIALKLEGLPRHCSTHAAGVVISPKPLWEFLPLYKGANDEITTQFAMGDVEKLGLLKMDFLGLRTLTVIHNALRLIRQYRGQEPDLNVIPLDDPPTYKLLCDARTMGVFQLESTGMRDLLKKLKPDCFEDIIALLALYRPGPLESGMVDTYVKCKHGTLNEKYDLPQLKDILQETHGVILYQEQVMKIANVLGGFSPGDADLLRRAMGKKKPEEMEQQKEKFLHGCKENQIVPAKSEKIFDLMAKFAGYGFNKSHSAAYALVSYQTAYLKTHYPLEFFGALITSEMDNADKVLRYINDCRSMSIRILPPDVNLSQRDFTISQDQIIFGLGAIKNVGSAAIDVIIETRNRLVKFSSLQEFCENVDMQKVNKRVMESLIKCGAFDSFGASRALMMHDLQHAMESGQARQRDRELGQTNLFDLAETLAEPPPQSNGNSGFKEWSDIERLKCEKETLGFYISGHPLTRFTRDLAWFTDTTSIDIADKKTGETVSLGGVPGKIITKVTKKGDKMAIVTLEDLHGTVEVILWPELYSACMEILQKDDPLLVTGDVDAEGNQRKVIAKNVYPLAEAKQKWKGKIHIQLRTAGLERQTLLQVKSILEPFKGNGKLFLHFIFPDQKNKVRSLETGMSIRPCDEVIDKIEALLGEGAIRLE